MSPFSGSMKYGHATGSPVAVVEARDKYQALDEALEKSEFFSFLRKQEIKTGKEKSGLRIAVKPNLMMFVSGKEMDVVTDPQLVEHLLMRLKAEGYTNAFPVESRNVYSNWYENRTVEQVALAAGYKSQFVDLSRSAAVIYDSPFMGAHKISAELYHVDVLVSFAKSKTHIASLVTLGIKNCFGLTWEQDKYAAYHARWGASVNHALMAVITNPDFPFVKNAAIFTIIDAWTSLDGFLGFKSAEWEIRNSCRFLGYGSFCGTPIPLPKTLKFNLGARRETGTIIAGEDLMRVERIAMIKMGVDEGLRKVNFPYWLMAKTFGEPEVHQIPLRGGEKNAGRELLPYDRPDRRFYSIGYSGLTHTWVFDFFIPWSTKIFEHFYVFINIASSWAPVDVDAFPRKNYFKTKGDDLFAIAFPTRRLVGLFLKSVKVMVNNIRLLPHKSTYRNIRNFLFRSLPPG